MKKVWGVWLILSILLLTGCEALDGVSYEEAQRVKHNNNDYGHRDLNELLDVGESLPLVKVIKTKSKYELLYEDENREIKSKTLDFNAHFVVKKSELPYSYLQRETNEVSEVSYGKGSAPAWSRFTLYINFNQIEGGTYTESCGGSCRRTLTEEVLD